MTTLRIVALPLFWLVAVIAMIAGYWSDPYSPLREGTRAYGHNHEGALTQGLLFVTVELIVVALIVRPWSYRQSWGRAVAAWVVFVPWTAMAMMLTMHAGNVLAIHFLWLLALSTVLTIVMVWSIATRLQQRTNGP